MQNSGVFSKNLYTFRVRAKLTQREVADMVGVRQQTVAAWEGNRSTPSPDVICILAKIFDITTDELLIYAQEMEEKWPKRRMIVPVVKTLRMFEEEYAEEEIIGREAIIAEYGVEYLYYQMPDNSLEPWIIRNDYVLIERTNRICDGEIGAFLIDDTRSIVRRYIEKEQGIILLPLNSEHHIEFLPDDECERITPIGKAIRAVRNL